MLTRRERIIELLESTEYPLTPRDICDALDIKSESTVIEDIEHIAKSVRSKNQEVIMRPARCAKCDFQFKSRGSPKRPSRCPKCKSEWIIAPAFMIRERKS
jgi:predicted Zn-ribbon and HTH transcriptional regulator